MKNYPSMDEMIADCEKSRKDGETMVFAIGAGRIAPMIGKTKAIKQGMDVIKKQEGFLGIHPVDLWHTLLIFDTLNNAKGARNTLKSMGMSLGQVVPILIPKEYAQRGKL